MVKWTEDCVKRWKENFEDLLSPVTVSPRKKAELKTREDVIPSLWQGSHKRLKSCVVAGLQVWKRFELIFGRMLMFNTVGMADWGPGSLFPLSRDQTSQSTWETQLLTMMAHTVTSIIVIKTLATKINTFWGMNIQTI